MPHIPGPWAVSSENWNDINGPSDLDMAYAINSDDWCIAEVWGDVPDDAAEGNARLMAAAPDLLEALKRSLDWLASYPGGGAQSAYDTARAAIAKAEGK